MRSKVQLVILIGMIILLAGCSEPGEESYNQGVKSLNYGKPAEARAQFLRALEENPKIAEAYLNLGRIGIKLGKYPEARENTLKALKMFKESQNTIISGGTWKEQAALANNNMASIAFQQALELNKDKNSNPAESERLLEEAKTWLAKAVELDHENETIQKNRIFIQKWENQK